MPPQSERDRSVGDTRTLEDELEQILVAATRTERERTALRRRLGWDGEAPATLAAAGREIDVTRERVRQMELEFRARVADVEVRSPLLERALELASSMPSAPANEIEDALREAGLTRSRFPLDSLRRAAEFVDRHRQRTYDRPGSEHRCGEAGTRHHA
ncbi:MAG: sigma factor-like helix-turn-helix DNA-binding protein [Chloroflexi bacterium]|nr:sigma factor-like helix-turn-helix DNA-binding protein [Chloroflexota bacterium]